MPRRNANPFATRDPYRGLSGLGELDIDPIYPGGAASNSPSAQQQRISDDAQIAQDAADLRELGYAAPDTWDAYDPGFQAAVRAFQADVSPRAGVVDGLIGPTTRAVIAQELAGKRGAPVPVPPAGPDLPPAPGPSPGPVVPVSPGAPAVTPASAKTDGPPWLLIGGAAAAAVLALVLLSSGGKKRKSNPSRRRRRRR